MNEQTNCGTLIHGIILTIKNMQHSLIDGTCLNLKIIMLSKRGETQKPYTVCFNMYGVLEKQRKTLLGQK